MTPARTKIVATIGPASRSRDKLARLLDEGVDVFRLNMSHGSTEDHGQALERLRELADSRGAVFAVMADLCGPKVRTGTIDPEDATLAAGAGCMITRESMTGTAEKFSTNYPGIVDDVSVSDRLLIEDGSIALRVVEKQPDALVCKCEVGGTLGTHKGLNLPDSDLSLPAVTEKDESDLRWAVANSVDYVAQSFVRRPEDLAALRERLDRAGGGDVPIVAKIETTQAVAALEEIVEAVDAVLVARGDLGVEMDVWRVPMVQKDIVRRCCRLGKPVIVATQMLQSMVANASPTRAEVSDAANAILDGADALMLSAESAVGAYPVESVRMLNRIALQVEKDRLESAADFSRVLAEGSWVGRQVDRRAAAVARSAVLIAQDLGAKLLVVWCRTGRTVRWISKYQIPKALVGLSSDGSLCRRLALCGGVEPRLVPEDFESGAMPSSRLYEQLTAWSALVPGDMIVVVGEPTAPHRASTINIHTV
ncbi:MAG: pyruvate kinase [Phycisphaerae bacterium]|jgi:pyruvate kinase